MKCKKPNLKLATEKPSRPIVYSPSFWNLKFSDNHGFGIKICVIDSGYPSHSDISVDTNNTVDFTQSSNGAKDVHGHATCVSGILSANNNKTIRGIVPACETFFAKAISDNGDGEYGSIIGSILWCVVKKIDIIVMAFGSEFFHPTLHDAVKKAYESNICLIASSGNHAVQTKDADYPARFPEVLCTGYSSDLKGDKIVTTNDEFPSILIPYQPLETTFLDNKYINISGTSCFAPVVAGLSALVLENHRKTQNKISSPRNIYQEVFRGINDKTL